MIVFQMRVKECLMRMCTWMLGWLLLVVPATQSVTTETMTAENSTTAEVPMTTEGPPLRLIHKESHTASIVVEWLVDEELTVDSLVIRSQKTGSDYMRHSPELNVSSRVYVIPDLVVDSKYRVCVLAIVSQEDGETGELESCEVLYTIPYLRLDSILALVIVLLVLGFLVLLGLICWRRAHRKATHHDDDSSIEGSITKKSESTQPILLAVPDDGRPRSSIEDLDIPYITPPLDELAQDDRDDAMKAMHNNTEAWDTPPHHPSQHQTLTQCCFNVGPSS